MPSDNQDDIGLDGLSLDPVKILRQMYPFFPPSVGECCLSLLINDDSEARLLSAELLVLTGRVDALERMATDAFARAQSGPDVTPFTSAAFKAMLREACRLAAEEP